MPNATVTVKDIWLPEGKKRHVLKAQDDKLYGVPAALAGQIIKGSSYELAYKIDNWNNKQYMVVEGVLPVTKTSPPPAPRAATTTEDERSIDIAVLALCKVVPSWFSQVEVFDRGAVTEILLALRTSWLDYKTASRLVPKTPAKPSLGEQMNDDEVPY
jgi:hypothetical protein